MSLSLSQLLTPLTTAQWETALLAAMQGLGFIEHRGTGTGGMTLSGTPSAPYDVQITIMAQGELGTGTFQYQLVDQNGVITTSAVLSIPGGGTYVLPSTGVTVTFASGPTGEGDSFGYLDTFGFSLTTPSLPVTAWQPGGVARTLINLWAQALADMDQLTATLAAAGLTQYVGTIGLSADAWADLLSQNVYGLTRNAAISTQGTVRLTAASGAGPYTITAGAVTVSDASGHKYTNIAGGTLGAGPATLDLTFQAESPGAAYNVGSNTITILVTALPGVTVVNSAAPWITTNGVDEETTAALMTRCQQRWAALGTGAPQDAYSLWATTASGEITRTNVVASISTPGEVDIYVAGPAGPVSGGAVTAAQTYIDDRAPLCVVPVVTNASGVAVTVTADVYVKAAQLTSAQATVAAALVSYFDGLPIGGDTLASASKGVSKEQLVRCVANAPGITDVTFTAPATDTVLTASQVATLTSNLTWHTV